MPAATRTLQSGETSSTSGTSAGGVHLPMSRGQQHSDRTDRASRRRPTGRTPRSTTAAAAGPGRRRRRCERRTHASGRCCCATIRLARFRHVMPSRLTASAREDREEDRGPAPEFGHEVAQRIQVQPDQARSPYLAWPVAPRRDTARRPPLARVPGSHRVAAAPPPARRTPPDR